MLYVHLQVVQSLRPYEVQRQEFIKELVYTERTHLHKLKTMKFVSLYSVDMYVNLLLRQYVCILALCLYHTLSYKVYKVPMKKESVLTQEQVDQLFPSLEELILYHSENYCCVCLCLCEIVCFVLKL